MYFHLQYKEWWQWEWDQTYPYDHSLRLQGVLHTFRYRVAEDEYLAPIWEEVARAKGLTEVLPTLNQVLLGGAPLI